MAVERITLVNPNRWKPRLAPIAVEYLSSALESQGFEVNFLDLCHVPDVRRAATEFFREHPTDLVGITLRNMDDIHYGRFMVPELRDTICHLRDATDAPMVLGGSGFSIYPERILEFCGLEMGIAGEGEFAFPMLAKEFGNTEAYADIPGLVYKQDGVIRRNPVGLGDVGSLCLSGRSKVDYSKYISPDGKKGGTAVQTKRGCPQDCIYCIVPNAEGRKMRLRPPSQVVDEIESLMAKGLRHIWFADSEFNCPEPHAREICAEIIRRGLPGKMDWMVYTSPKPFSLELAKLMKEAGCFLNICTIENANERILKCLRKDFNADDIRHMAKCCVEAGLTFSYCAMFGAPGETVGTVLETLEVMKEIRAKGVTFWDPHGFRIYPNTPLVDIVRAEGFTRKNPNLHGRIEGNDDFFEPVYYLSAEMGILATATKAWRKLGLVRQGIARWFV